MDAPCSLVEAGLVSILKAHLGTSIQSIQAAIRDLKGLSPDPAMQSKTAFYLISTPGLPADPQKRDQTDLYQDIRHVWVHDEFMQTYLDEEVPEDVRAVRLSLTVSRYLTLLRRVRWLCRIR